MNCGGTRPFPWIKLAAPLAFTGIPGRDTAPGRRNQTP